MKMKIKLLYKLNKLVGLVGIQREIHTKGAGIASAATATAHYD